MQLTVKITDESSVIKSSHESIINFNSISELDEILNEEICEILGEDDFDQHANDVSIELMSYDGNESEIRNWAKRSNHSNLLFNSIKQVKPKYSLDNEMLDGMLFSGTSEDLIDFTNYIREHHNYHLENGYSTSDIICDDCLLYLIGTTIELLDADDYSEGSIGINIGRPNQVSNYIIKP